MDPLDAEIPVMLTRADYDRTRRRFYSLFAEPRNDDRFPKLTPPGAVLVQSVDQNPVFDVAAQLSSFVPLTASWVALQPADTVAHRVEQLRIYAMRDPPKPFGRGDRRYDDYLIRYNGLVQGDTSVVGFPVRPGEVRDNQELASAISLNSVDGGGWADARYTWSGTVWLLTNPDWLSGSQAGGGLMASGANQVAINRPYVEGVGQLQPREGDRATLSDQWWYDTPWGQEKAAVWNPDRVLGMYGWEPAAYGKLPAGAQFVAVRYPHPYIVGMPEPIRVVTAGTCSGGCQNIPFGIYPSPVIITGTGDRQRPEYWADISAWMGGYEDEDDNWTDSVVQFIAENAALQAAVIAAAAIITYGTGGAAVAGALSSAAAGGAAGGGLATIPGAVAAPLLANPVAAGAILTAAAPDEVNAALTTVAEYATYADLVPYVGQLWGLTFTELTIRAQKTQERRDALRAELSQLRAEISREEWFIITKHTIQAVASVIMIAAPALSGVDIALSAIEEAALQIGHVAVSAATQSLQLVNAIGLADVAKRQVKESATAALTQLSAEGAAISAEIAHLERELAAQLIEQQGQLEQQRRAAIPTGQSDSNALLVIGLAAAGGAWLFGLFGKKRR